MKTIYSNIYTFGEDVGNMFQNSLTNIETVWLNEIHSQYKLCAGDTKSFVIYLKLRKYS